MVDDGVKLIFQSEILNNKTTKIQTAPYKDVNNDNKNIIILRSIKQTNIIIEIITCITGKTRKQLHVLLTDKNSPS